MTSENLTETSPGIELFPEYAELYDLISREVRGLTDEQLDWESDEWEWAKWSIRRQLSHMASLIYRWLVVRWGETLFPNNDHGVRDIEGITNSPSDRQLDETKYNDLPTIMDFLRSGINLIQRVLSERTVRFLRRHSIPHNRSPQWILMYKAHPTGIEPLDESPIGTISLEATIRHMYFEEITHLYNIQRLKRAQGLPAVVEVPRVGYWTLDGWDTSEAV